MPDNRTIREFERYCKAAMVGIAVPLSVAVLAIIASIYKGSFSLEVWGTTVEFVVIGAIPGIVAGVVGASVGYVGRASAYGATIFLCVAGEYLWFGCTSTWPIIAECVVLASAVGALAGGGGAAIGRTALATGDRTKSPRLPLRELAIAGFLAAILLSYIFWIV